MNISNENVVFHSAISSIQKVALYETKTRLYLIGSNNQQTRFRILEIDRTVKNELRIVENPHEIGPRDIRRFVGTLGNAKTISAYGVLGFVKFREGYYLMLVTKRTLCAVIGMHLIYTIKDTVMVRVNEPPRQPDPLEQRYVKMFCNIDLRSNFYFSYSYDLTRSLQYNMSAPRFVGENANIQEDDPLPTWGENIKEKIEYAFRGMSRKRFVWNAFLLKPMSCIMQKDWQLEITHGFISQSNFSIFGRPVYVCLLARRSTRFAGTRFLKRGANMTGDVANEVETEQIVMDGHRLCSFVQMRGSIPSHWSQDISKMVPKPPIGLDMSDPYAETAGKHFERLLIHYGAPIIVLNLVKEREKRKHESLLTVEMRNGIKYLNQFLPPQYRTKYIHFDMARKSRGGNVMASLADIAETCIQLNGMFIKNGSDVSFQTGMVRVNCVDCLDRTNTAQFAIGKCVLAHQLCRLGFIDPPKLEFDSDCITMLESLYEDHGDTLALQYGGSQLVHRIKTYRKTAAWTSQGNDIMQTLSRYYSNTFSDTEKQHSINLFLGYFIPYDNFSRENLALWELPNDYYMHNLRVSGISPSLTPLTQWVRPITLKHLPYSTSDSNKVVKELIRVHSNLEMIDSYSNYYLPFKYTPFEEHIAYQISHLARNFAPTFRTNFSPFEPGRRREKSSLNPSLTGQSSTSSTNSSTSSSMDEDSSEDETTIDPKKEQSPIDFERSQTFSIRELLPSMMDVYGMEVKTPDKPNLVKYKRYVQVGKLTIPGSSESVKSATKQRLYSVQIPPAPLDGIMDCSEQVTPPTVDDRSINVYKKYVELPNKVFQKSSSQKTLDLIEKYINFGI